ncbi:CDP-diacylglycerol--serine O-phosphatidyltransferase [Thermosulfuriphilus sp.]
MGNRDRYHHKHHEPAAKRGIFLLPSLFTTASLFSGFYALIAAISGDFIRSAIAIICAAIFDILDGRVARATHTVSRFGTEYDSLSDLVSFGVAPAILAFLWALKPYGRFGWLAAFLYVATTALRLARFNIQSGGSRRYFIGLPSPAAAGMVATTVLFSHYLGTTGPIKHLSVLVMIYLLSYLMVSNIRYYSFKTMGFLQRRPFYTLVAFVLLFIVVATEPQVTLFFLGIAYVLSGPLLLLSRLLRGKEESALAP